LEGALAALDAVILLGTDEPEIRIAADRARACFERMGAAPLLRRLEVAVAGPVA
jgi:hypothetical protein